jgi:DNA-binding transcriptional regulator/RsmH inhibitor MraZ
MFGDVPIYGKKIMKVESKHRIVIPSSCNAEVGELIFFSEENELTFQIFGLKILEARLKEYKDLINSAKTKEEEAKWQKEKNAYNFSIIGESCVDSQKRIILPKEVLEKYNIEKTVITQGVYDHIKVFSNEKDREEYILKYNK